MTIETASGARPQDVPVGGWKLLQLEQSSTEDCPENPGGTGSWLEKRKLYMHGKHTGVGPLTFSPMCVGGHVTRAPVLQYQEVAIISTQFSAQIYPFRRET